MFNGTTEENLWIFHDIESYPPVKGISHGNPWPFPVRKWCATCGCSSTVSYMFAWSRVGLPSPYGPNDDLNTHHYISHAITHRYIYMYIWLYMYIIINYSLTHHTHTYIYIPIQVRFLSNSIGGYLPAPARSRHPQDWRSSKFRYSSARSPVSGITVSHFR